MKGTTRWTIGIVLGALAVHFATVRAIPRLIMSTAMQRLMAETGPNVFQHPALATSESRTIVRPSPDLAYSSAVFDVSERALRVRVPVTEPYTSLSGFAAHTDNIFALNDLHATAGWIDVVLVGPSTPRAGLEPGALIESPSDRGILLVRRVVPSPDALPAIEAARAQERIDATTGRGLGTDQERGRTSGANRREAASAVGPEVRPLS